MKHFEITTNDKTLYALQRLEISALKEIDRICRKHGIEYSLGGGTCLGQVRHGGFIPWDDDIDIDMAMPDYTKFLSVAEKELAGTGFSLLSRKTDSTWKRSWSRVTVDGTRLNLLSNIKHGLSRPVFVDIFCWSHLPNNAVMRKLVSSGLYYLRCALKYQETETVEGTLSFRERQNVVRIAKVIPYCVVKGAEYLLAHICGSRKTKWMLEDVTVKGNFGGYPVEGVMDEFTDVKFEDLTVRSRKNTDLFLRTLYGNHYGQWLRPEQRISYHTWADIDLGRYAEEYGLPDDYRECFLGSHTKERVKLMKQLSYNLVDQVDIICEGNNLKYYVMGIECVLKRYDLEKIADFWQEPMVLAMPYDDYKRFRALCLEEPDSRYSFEDSTTNGEYHFTYGRFHLKYTYIREDRIPRPLENRIDSGLFIKIVPLVCGDEDSETRKRQISIISQTNRNIWLKWTTGYKKNKTRREAAKRIMLKFTSMKSLERKLEVARTQCGNTGCVIDGSGGILKRMSAEKELFGEGVREIWQGHSFMFPDKIEELVDEVYGNVKLEETGGGKRLVAYSKDGQVSAVYTDSFTEDEFNRLQRQYHACSLNYYDLPEMQLSVLRYDEKEDRLLSNEEIFDRLSKI